MIQYVAIRLEVRVLTIDNEPWFVGKDVAEAFGDTNYRRSIARLDDDEKTVTKIDTAGGAQNITIINESGLYSLLFYMQPQKVKGVSQNDTLINERINKLKKFKHWVTAEVLSCLSPPTAARMDSDTIFSKISY